MYSTCLHYHKPLGRNDAVEHFPIGRRFAFDSAKGRLWIVCQHCARWNLTPIEERWEAVEESETAFRAQRLRAQTDNIGLVLSTMLASANRGGPRAGRTHRLLRVERLALEMSLQEASEQRALDGELTPTPTPNALDHA